MLKTIASMEKGDIFTFVGAQSPATFTGMFIELHSIHIYCNVMIVDLVHDHSIRTEQFSSIILRQERICRHCIARATCKKEEHTIDCAKMKGFVV